jgi:hypothetical protein
MTDIPAAVPDHCKREFGFNPDSMVKDVIRVFKAWARYGLPYALQQQQQQQQAVGSSSGSGSPPAAAAGAGYGTAPLPAGEPPAGVAAVPGGCDYTKQPPGYMLEVFVVFVLLRQLRAGQAAGTPPAQQYPTHTRTLQLFLDVLAAAAEMLQPGSPDPIALNDLYTQEQCELFRELWGPVGPLCTPFIISPVDPSYNCTKHSAFKGWGGVAAAAGQLYQQLQALLGSDGPVGGSSSGGAVPGTAVWQQLLSSSSLGPAVWAFQAATADAAAASPAGPTG